MKYARYPGQCVECGEHAFRDVDGRTFCPNCSQRVKLGIDTGGDGGEKA